jgi:hypothetical protein
MVNVKYLLVAAMLLLSGMSVATAKPIGFKGVIGLGADLGGDVLDSGVYADGTSWDVKANQGLALNIGMVMVTGAFETQLTAGYKSGGPQAKNGSIIFDSSPVELMEFYRTSNIRMGLGIVSHGSPKLVKDAPVGAGTLANGTYKFGDAVGTIAQIGWAPAKSFFSIDLRYTTVKFQSPANYAALGLKKEYSGNVAGLYMSFFF